MYLAPDLAPILSFWHYECFRCRHPDVPTHCLMYEPSTNEQRHHPTASRESGVLTSRNWLNQGPRGPGIISQGSKRRAHYPSSESKHGIYGGFHVPPRGGGGILNCLQFVGKQNWFCRHRDQNPLKVCWCHIMKLPYGEFCSAFPM